jgi:streptogramin lyase
MVVAARRTSARLVAAVVIAMAGLTFSGSAAHADPAGTMVAFPVTPATGPVIAIGGPDGNIWFTENFGDAVGRMVPGTGAFLEFAIPTAGSQPGGDHSRSRRRDVVR